jgi:hypothetical protein
MVQRAGREIVRAIIGRASRNYWAVPRNILSRRSLPTGTMWTGLETARAYPGREPFLSWRLDIQDDNRNPLVVAISVVASMATFAEQDEAARSGRNARSDIELCPCPRRQGRSSQFASS